ncbi:MAG: hypothetical protein H6673_07900 [Anaerolineales bacterium]|nr:hypothetical protein [Anaerolineales bacterium]
MPRPVTNNLITSEAMPAIRVQVHPSLTYVGTLESTLRQTSFAEIAIFVDADEQGRISRKLTVYFEHFLESALDKRFRYNTPETVTLNGVVYQTDLRCVPSHLYLEDDDTESDWQQINRYLAGQGYAPPYHQEQVLTKRLIRLLGDDQRAEFLLVYNEAHAGPPHTHPDDMYLVLKSDDRQHLAGFEQRALASFQLLG